MTIYRGNKPKFQVGDTVLTDFNSKEQEVKIAAVYAGQNSQTGITYKVEGRLSRVGPQVFDEDWFYTRPDHKE